MGTTIIASTSLRGIKWRVVWYLPRSRSVDPYYIWDIEYHLPGETWFSATDYHTDTGRPIPKTIMAWAIRAAATDPDLSSLRRQKRLVEFRPEPQRFRVVLKRNPRGRRRNPRTPLPGHLPVSSAWLKNFEREFGKLSKSEQRQITAEARAEQRRMRPMQTNPGKRKLGWNDPALQAAWRDAVRILGRTPRLGRGRR